MGSNWNVKGLELELEFSKRWRSNWVDVALESCLRKLTLKIKKIGKDILRRFTS